MIAKILKPDGILRIDRYFDKDVLYFTPPDKIEKRRRILVTVKTEQLDDIYEEGHL